MSSSQLNYQNITYFTCDTVKSIIARYTRALENVVESRRAFELLDEAAPSADKALWLAEIEEAERKRPDHPQAMDIMQSRIKVGATLKEITTDIMREDGKSLPDIPDNGSATEWLLAGLRIEDEQ